VFWKWAEQPPPDDLPAVDQRRWRLTRLGMQLRLITAQRGQEVFTLRRSDVDGAWWTIPEQWSKNGLAHRVYLSKLALAVLAKLEKETGADVDDLFRGVRGRSRRRGAFNDLELPGAEAIRPHDLRRTAATLMTSGGVPRLTVAKILNHVDNTVTAIYDRASYDADKQAALTWWSAKLDAILKGETSKVLPFRVRRTG
jgi:integrase